MMNLLAQYIPPSQMPPADQEPAWYESARAIGKHVKSGFDSSTLFPPQYFYLAAVALLLVIAGLWLWKRHKTRHLRPRPFATFNQVASHIGLSTSDQWLLLRIARQQKLPTPLTLILSGTTLDHHAQSYLQSIHRSRQDNIQTRVAAIGQFLFDPQALHENTQTTNEQG